MNILKYSLVVIGIRECSLISGWGVQIVNTKIGVFLVEKLQGVWFVKQK